MTELPGGSVGCDVCGLALDTTKVDAHEAWHRFEDERFDRLLHAVQELVDLLNDRRA